MTWLLLIIVLLLVVIYILTRPKSEPYKMDAETAGLMWDVPGESLPKAQLPDPERERIERGWHIVDERKAEREQQLARAIERLNRNR